MTTERQERNFWAKVVEIGECWIWTGARDTHGYGMVRRGTRPGVLRYAHRIAWEDMHGPIPEGLVLDHLCKTPLCIRFDHLDPVTQGENVRRGNRNGNREKTHCKRGHEFVPSNTRRQTNGGRSCIACKVDYDRLRRIEKAA